MTSHAYLTWFIGCCCLFACGQPSDGAPALDAALDATADGGASGLDSAWEAASPDSARDAALAAAGDAHLDRIDLDVLDVRSLFDVGADQTDLGIDVSPLDAAVDGAVDAAPSAGDGSRSDSPVDARIFPQRDASCGACETGAACCPVGVSYACVRVSDSGVCPLPDLLVSRERLMSTLEVEWQTFAPSSCAIFEGCIVTPGARRLLRFDTFTPNIGTADFTIGNPSAHPDLFEFSTCHGHYHFGGYADYRLINSAGVEVGRGHKQAFCLLDSEEYIPGSPPPRYDCGDQGISRGWGDVYSAGLDCQWVDVTDVAPGNYTLRVSVNNDRIIQESDYANNIVEIPVVVTLDLPPPPTIPTDPCASPTSGENRNCGWENAGTFTCFTGTTVTLGCAQECGPGFHVADTVLRVCAGDASCSAATAIASNDDAPGECNESLGSIVSFACPALGRYTVLRGPFRSGEAFACEFELDSSDGGVRSDAASSRDAASDARIKL